MLYTDLAPTTTELQMITIIHHPIELVTMMNERETASTWIKETIKTQDTREGQMPLLVTTNHVIVGITEK